MERVNQAAVREVTRKIQERTRDDWTFDRSIPSDPPSHGDGKTLSYRERYFSETEDEGSALGTHGAKDGGRRRLNPYRFDHPDDVGDALDRMTLGRNKRKWSLLAEELRYNDGLRHFIERQNAWTSAVPRGSGASKEQTTRESQFEPLAKFTVPSHHEAESEIRASPLDSELLADKDSTTSEEAATEADTRWDSDARSICNVTLPITTPLVPPDNVVRTQMTSRPHSELYEKIVRDSRSPAIPINLAHMTQIIVQGWKDEGNWPPPSTAPDFTPTGRRRVQKAITVRQGLGYGDTGTAHGLLANHRHLRHGVDSVKRAFRLSGSNVPPNCPQITLQQQQQQGPEEPSL